MEPKTICVFDFCGYSHPGHFLVQQCADYYPELGVVKFGLDWCEIPDWNIDHEPTEEEVIDYVQSADAKEEVF